jgi:hypothetical protein
MDDNVDKYSEIPGLMTRAASLPNDSGLTR